MGHAEEALAPETTEDAANEAWAESLRGIMRQVISTLPDDATLGDLVAAARNSTTMGPVLDIFTVHELIETAKKRPRPASGEKGEHDKRTALGYDGEEVPILDLDAGPAVIRRRADLPDGDIRILRTLAESGPQRESELANPTGMTQEQMRIVIRHLRAMGYLHIEGSGLKRRLKITRSGSGFLRKNTASAPRPSAAAHTTSTIPGARSEVRAPDSIR